MVLLILVVSIGIVIGGFLVVGYVISEEGHAGPVTTHFNGKRFFNETGVKVKGFAALLKWQRTRLPGPWTYREGNSNPPPPDRVTVGVRITLVNHSTFLIQYEGLNILTDPVWSERVSPFPWAGPKRMQPPGFSLERLPTIDLILLSHNHYDHLDLETLKFIVQRDHPRLTLPLGVGKLLTKHGVENFVELDWWEVDDRLTAVKVTSIPAQHFSARGTFDRNNTLWCGFVIQWESRKIYFAGDTGYNTWSFKEIGKRIGPVDISIIPIGAYKPEWFMSPIHCSPSEAVMIHKEVQSRRSIACHFGTFPLADDGENEPIEELKVALSKENISLSEFMVLDNGEAFLD